MSKVARFDQHATDAYLSKVIPASASHAYEVDFHLTGTALAGESSRPGGTLPAMLGIVKNGGDINSRQDNIQAFRWASPTDPFDWAGAFGNVDSGVPVTAGAGTLRIEHTYNSGTAMWDSVYKVNGVAAGSGSNIIDDGTTPATGASTLLMFVGAYAGDHVASGIYYITAVRVYNAATAGTLIFSEDFSSGTFAAWGSTAGAASIVDAAAIPTYSLELWDWQTDTFLADLTGAATFTIKPRRSGQPLAVVAELAADTASIQGVWTDTYPVLNKGIRSLKVRKNGTLIGHALVWRLDYTGDENNIRVTVTGYDPLILLKGRPYRDTTGNLIDPNIASPISGAAILKDGVVNSVSNSGPAGDHEGTLPLGTTTGTFDTTIPPAIDLGVELADWPIMLDELVTRLADTGAVDIWVTPVETAGTVGQLNVANRRGTDLSATVHFDYATGNHSIRAVTRSDDMDELQNKLYYYLGPKVSVTQWQGNITATELTPYNLSAYQTLQNNSRTKYGFTVMRIRTFDDDAANAVRQMYHELWKEEVASSVEGREIVKITPAVGAPFEPFDDYNPGDTIAINIANTGPALTAATQRVDGFDVTVGLDGTGQVSELLTLQDG